MSDVSGNPALPNANTDQLAGQLFTLLPPMGMESAGMWRLAEQLHQVLLLAGWREPTRVPDGDQP